MGSVKKRLSQQNVKLFFKVLFRKLQCILIKISNMCIGFYFFSSENRATCRKCLYKPIEMAVKSALYQPKSQQLVQSVFVRENL